MIYNQLSLQGQMGDGPTLQLSLGVGQGTPLTDHHPQRLSYIFGVTKYSNTKAMFFWTKGGRQITWQELIHAQGEHETGPNVGI